MRFLFLKRLLMLLQDSNNCLYPLSKDSVGGIQNPTWTNFSSVQCIATGRKHGSVPRRPGAKSKQLALTVMVMEENTVLQTIIAGDWENLRKLLEKALENKGKDICVCITNFKRKALILCILWMVSKPLFLD